MMSSTSLHYDEMKPKYGSGAHLLCNYSDSLMYELKSEDIYQDMIDRSAMFAMSTFDARKPFYRPEFQRNKAQVELLKDKAGGYGLIFYVGLLPKIYSFEAMKLIPDGTAERFEQQRVKAIQGVVAAKVTNENYKNQLNTHEENLVNNP